MELHDPHLNGGIFTWFKGASHHSVTRLDRFLYSMEWEELFRSIIQQIMLRVIFDHNPIILQWFQRSNPGPRIGGMDLCGRMPRLQIQYETTDAKAET
ncbi:hypothetical protein H5410_052853 [Solanum commersonii]|uniref:Uncharacterized protein n=1 Tax=Solanum commersonii TaxID=4109 RepID=A0A9J5X2P7_SOLCO|nr:hypothetical protein H5410_052853 [Solanum commersonii]